MILLLQSYTPSCDERRKELAECRRQNEECGFFDEIVDIDGSRKRLTYAEAFDYAAGRFSGEQCVLANSDISFAHPSCELMKSIVAKTALVVLTRWHDNVSPWMVGHNVGLRFFSGSQDVWGFIGGKYRGMCDIPLGEPGCDCRVVAEFTNAGIPVWNPALSVRVMHVHKNLNDVLRESPVGAYGYAELSTVEGLGGVLMKEYPENRIIEYIQRARQS